MQLKIWHKRGKKYFVYEVPKRFLRSCYLLVFVLCPQEPWVSNYRVFSVLCSQLDFHKIIFLFYSISEKLIWPVGKDVCLHFGTQWLEDFYNFIALHYNFYRRLFINIKSIKGQSIRFLFHCCHLYAILERTHFHTFWSYNSKLSISFIKWLLNSTAPTTIAKLCITMTILTLFPTWEFARFTCVMKLKADCLTVPADWTRLDICFFWGEII